MREGRATELYRAKLEETLRVLLESGNGGIAFESIRSAAHWPRKFPWARHRHEVVTTSSTTYRGRGFVVAEE